MKTEKLDQLIADSLCEEPAFSLPADFAQKIVSAVARRQQWKADLREYFLLTAVVALLVTAVAGFYYWMDPELVLLVWRFISGNMIQVVSVVFVLNFIFLADRVLLRLLFNRWSKI